MGDSNKIVIEISADDKGSGIIKKFADDTRSSFDSVGRSTETASGYFDKMKNSVISYAAGMAAAYLTVNQAIEAVQIGAKALQAEESFRLVAKSAGESADGIVEAMKRASAGTVDESDIMQKAVKGITLGLRGDQLIEIMEAARISARVTGEDVKTAYEKITDAIATGMPRALKQYGLITKEEMALVNAALKAGVTDVDLYSIAMDNAKIQAAKFGDIQLTVAERVQQSQARMKDFHETAAKETATLYAKMIEWAGEAIVAFGKVADTEAGIFEANFDYGEQNLAMSRKQTAVTVEEAEKQKAATVDRIKSEIEAHKAAEKAAKEREAAEKEIIETIRKASVEIESIGKTAYEKDISRIELQAEKFKAAKVAEVEIVKFVETEKALAVAKSNEAIRVIREKADEEAILANYKTLQEQTKAIEDAKAEDVKLYLKAVDEQIKSEDAFAEANYKRLMEQANAGNKYYEDQEKLAHKRFTDERRIAGDIAKFTNDEYDLKKSVLDEEYRDLQKVLGDSDTLRRWYAIKEQELLEEKILRSNNFWDGMAVAYAQDLRNQGTWGQQGAEIWRGVFGRGGATEGLLDTFFTDVFNGHLQSAMDYFNSFKDAIISTFARMIAEMTAQWIAFSVIGLPGGSGGNLSLLGSLGTAGNGGSGGGGGGTGLIGLAQQAYSAYSNGGTIADAGIAAYDYLATAFTPATSTGAVAGMEAGAAAAQTSAGAVAGIEAGTATSAGAVAGMEAGAAGAGAGANAGAGAGMAGSYGSLAGPAAFTVLTAAMLAYGFADIASWEHFWQNPFDPQAANPLGLTQMQLLALTDAGMNVNSISQMDQIQSNPYLLAAFQPAIDRLKGDPAFNPENIYNAYSSMIGRPANLDDVKSGSPFNWFYNSPEFHQAVQDLQPLRPYGIEDWLTNQEGGGTGGGGARGMDITEQIIGLGLQTGAHYAFGENTPFGEDERIEPIRRGSAGRGSGLSIGNIQIFLDGKEIGGVVKIIADGVVVARNRSGVNPTTRVYQ